MDIHFLDPLRALGHIISRRAAAGALAGALAWGRGAELGLLQEGGSATTKPAWWQLGYDTRLSSYPIPSIFLWLPIGGSPA